MVRRLLYAMLLFAPVAFIAEFVLHVDPVMIFILAAIAIIPLAKFVGEATEELAIHTGPRIGGLLNATLGNAAELIITIFAIREGLLELVRASITGSIIGNLLLVMGLSLLLGGLKNGIQAFDRRTAGINAVLLVLSVSALLVPSLFDAAIAPDLAAELGLSEGVAVVMIVLYGLYVFYGLTSGDPHVVREPATPGDTAATQVQPSHAADEHHTARWSVRTSVIVLALATLGIVVMSEILVGAVEVVTEELGLTEVFIGLIVIPLVGNVAEHLVAVQVAYKNKMELSMAVSLGSSLQIALFVAPVLVFISLLFGQTLLLVFTPFELIALLVASILAAFIALDGESNWLEGAMLLGVYIILAIAFYYLPA
ncbi:MAG: calcium/proton exchanger [Anaerolineae bacterium]